MTFKRNLTELKSYVSRAPEANRSKIRDVIKLYEDKKIVNFRTALNATLLLSSTNKNTLKSGRAEKEYSSIINKYGEAQPITGRLKRQEEEVKKKVERNTRIKGILKEGRKINKSIDLESEKKT
jgi:hypothetical protein